MSGHLALAPEGPWPWGHRVWATLHARWMLSAFSAALVIGMLLAFYNVVRQAAYESALHQQALAAQSQAIWRCKRIPSISARRGCLLAVPTLLASSDRPTAPVSP
jgi:hypothetical protein